MANESEIRLLGTALSELDNSTDLDDKHVAQLLSAALRIRGERGDIIYRLNVDQALSTAVQKPAESPKYFPAIPLADELERQRVEAAERIAVPLGIDRNKFFAKLPSRFPNRTGDYDKYALTTPLISLDLTPFGFSWLQVTEAALFYNPNDPKREVIKAYILSELKKATANNQLTIWKDPREGVRSFPKVPHGVWIQDGSRYVGKKPRDVRKELEKVERAGDHFKGTSLAVLRPDVMQTMWWDFIGGQVGSGSVPFGGWDDRPRFDYYWDDFANPGYRALVCGSEYTVA